MDLQLLSFPIILCFVFFMLMVRKIGKKSTSNLPPGPWKLPFIGNLHQLVGSQPHHVLQDLAKKHGPLMYLQLSEVPTLVVSSAEYAKEVMKTHDLVFASRPRILASEIMSYNSTNILFSPHGEYWRQLRKICTIELLSTKRVQSFRPIREEVMSEVIEWIFSQAGSAINLTQKIFSSTYTLSSRVTLGREFGYEKEFISITEESTKLGAGFNIADVFPSIKLLHWISGVRSKLKKMHEQSDRMLGHIINEHLQRRATSKVEKDEDLVDVLLKLHEQGNHEFSLTMDNVKAVILDMLAAGSETSSTTVDWAMAEMMKNPKVMEKAQAEVRQVFGSRASIDETGISELKYLMLVVKETLRLHPAAPLLLPRENSERCEINNYEIPIKTKVIVNAWAIARDPKYWTEPEKFYPERFLDSSIEFKGTDFEYIPFGAGRRICPGITFGLATVELHLSQLLYYFDWKLPNEMKPDDLDMTEEFGASVSRRDDLYLIPIPYHSSLFSKP
ncbi:cytochrome P450 71D9-like [Tripterygium wilfordii]|uniref:cytochrome P450 71D9-like n=1 Tax=Tripterygium wilfordii TaxID=458696 RepID=UPI0018F7E939|nr:cytochrome P450 71D9-like [Tripterygium wilfordii]